MFDYQPSQGYLIDLRDEDAREVVRQSYGHTDSDLAVVTLVRRGEIDLLPDRHQRPARTEKNLPGVSSGSRSGW